MLATLIKNGARFDNNDGIKFQTLRSSRSECSLPLIKALALIPHATAAPEHRERSRKYVPFPRPLRGQAFFHCGDDLRDAFMKRVLVRM